MRGIVVGLGGWGSTWTQVIRDGGWDIAAWVDVNPGAWNLQFERGSMLTDGVKSPASRA